MRVLTSGTFLVRAVGVVEHAVVREVRVISEGTHQRDVPREGSGGG